MEKNLFCLKAIRDTSNSHLICMFVDLLKLIGIGTNNDKIVVSPKQTYALVHLFSCDHLSYLLYCVR